MGWIWLISIEITIPFVVITLNGSLHHNLLLNPSRCLKIDLLPILPFFLLHFIYFPLHTPHYTVSFWITCYVTYWPFTWQIPLSCLSKSTLTFPFPVPSTISLQHIQKHTFTSYKHVNAHRH